MQEVLRARPLRGAPALPPRQTSLQGGALREEQRKHSAVHAACAGGSLPLLQLLAATGDAFGTGFDGQGRLPLTTAAVWAQPASDGPLGRICRPSVRPSSFGLRRMQSAVAVQV